MEISVAYYSDIGGREKNEDAASLLESGGTVLGIVADGLGGHFGGEIAAQIAVSTITTRLNQYQLSTSALQKAVEEANRTIFEDGRGGGMKSTVAVVWIDRQRALTATVGDTRIYQFRNQKIRFQSKDHSVAQMEVLAGHLSEKDIRGSKIRNRLVRALGAMDDVKTDIAALDVEAKDAFLICSDGFWGCIWEDEMLEALKRACSAAEWLAIMRQTVSSRITENGDNHTAVTIIVKE